LFANYFFQQ
jgi:serine/threonine protein kinase